jgi:hypothetical protein
VKYCDETGIDVKIKIVMHEVGHMGPPNCMFTTKRPSRRVEHTVGTIYSPCVRVAIAIIMVGLSEVVAKEDRGGTVEVKIFLFNVVAVIRKPSCSGIPAITSSSVRCAVNTKLRIINRDPIQDNVRRAIRFHIRFVPYQ